MHASNNGSSSPGRRGCAASQPLVLSSMKIEKACSNHKQKFNLQNSQRDLIQHLRIRDTFGKCACRRLRGLAAAVVAAFETAAETNFLALSNRDTGSLDPLSAGPGLPYSESPRLRGP
jgi:hypothetical protein